jgi:hypothetical protein
MLTCVNLKKRSAQIVGGRLVRPHTTEPVGRRKQEKKKNAEPPAFGTKNT